MSEILITWESILPLMFFERFIVASVGAGMFIHFVCMATVAPVKSPHIVYVFLAVIGGASAAMMFCAITGQIPEMYKLLLAGISSMFLFWLWLWRKGWHVKDFLEKKYGTQ